VSGTGVRRYFVARDVGQDGAGGYSLYTLYEGETVESVTDPADGTRTSVVRRGGEVVNVVGEMCGGEFTDRSEARVHAGRLHRVLELMES
jgi:hypothetical protein